MVPVNFVYCNREYFFKNILIFTSTLDSDKKNSKEQYDKIFVKYCRSKNNLDTRDYWGLSDDELLSEMIIKELPKPTTFPKFSNETPFKFMSHKLIYNPKIISIRWSGYEWEYQLENIGHKTDYQPEKNLI